MEVFWIGIILSILFYVIIQVFLKHPVKNAIKMFKDKKGLVQKVSVSKVRK